MNKTEVAKLENDIAWRQSFIDEIFTLVHFAEKPLTMTKHFKQLKKICKRYGME